MVCRISILGLYEYDPTLFDDIELPENLDKDELVETILFQNAELGLLYSDPALMKKAITRWSKISQYAWTKLANSLEFEYNPIWNRETTTEETETIGRDGSSESSGDTTGKVSAYNSSTFENKDKNEFSSESSMEEASERTLERHSGGNIGVTTTQHLIDEERRIARYNIYDEISSDFRRRFCIMVY